MHTNLHPVTFRNTPPLRTNGEPRFNNAYLVDGAGDSQIINWDRALWEWTLQFKKRSREWG